MHFRTFVTFDKDKAGNSEEAREFAFEFLEENGFTSQGVFSTAPADWFVVGGRWSGLLQDTDEFFDNSNEAIGKKEGEFISMKDVEDEENKKKLQKLWEDLGKTGLNPYTRNQYEKLGYEDDAMIVTKEIYDKHLKEFEGLDSDGNHYWDLDMEELDRDVIGNKWVVVIDYHS